MAIRKDWRLTVAKPQERALSKPCRFFSAENFLSILGRSRQELRGRPGRG